MKSIINKRNITVLIAILFIVQICKYMYISVDMMPMSDFWLGSGAHITSIMTDNYHLSDILQFPHLLHWNPYYMACDYFFVKFFLCDNRAYVYMGFFVSFFIMALFLKIYNEIMENDNLVLFTIGCFAFVIPLFNLNAWEIYTLFCNFAFMSRILVYVAMFYYFDRILKMNDNPKRRINAIIWGISSIFVILFISQAYFIGFVAAILFAIFIDLVLNKRRQYIEIYAYESGCMLLASIIYYVTLIKEGTAASSELTLLDHIKTFIKGTIVMLGGTIIHTNELNEGLTKHYVVGIIVLLIALLSVVLFFGLRIYEKSYFQIMLMVYAFVSIEAIIVGRVYKYGIESLASSRYVVESTLGLCGVVQICWIAFISNKIKYVKTISLLCCAIVVAGVLRADHIERDVGPYRKAYNAGMVSLALNIDNSTDDELKAFLTPPAEVRAGVQAMKEYRLNIWHYDIPIAVESN